MSKPTLCLVTYGGYPDPTEIVSGNGVRGHFLAAGLVSHGFRIAWLYPAFLEPDKNPRRFQASEDIEVSTYADSDDLQRQIREQAPSAVLVGYWELLEHFPEDYPLPVVVDVVAPRILEALYEPQRDLDEDVEKLLRLYRRADLFLAGNERQRHFLLPWLILAGFDCRARMPVLTLPISVTPLDSPKAQPPGLPLRLVTGGVSWPWRNSRPWLERLVAELRQLPAGSARLHLLSGKYVYAGGGDGAREADPWPADLVVSESLKPYGEMSGFFAGHCDIGIELADRNTEREYSQSFRAMEFLRAGLPLICNGYLELAAHVKEFDAGWVIDDAEQLPGVIREIVAEPAQVARKSANALELVNKHFHCVENTRELAAFLRNPESPVVAAKPMLLDRAAPVQKPAAATPPVAPRPKPRGSRLRRLAGRALRKALRTLFPGRPGVVVSVSRSDVFPADHGAAVKIDRTAWGLSHQMEAVYLVTDSRHTYHRYLAGERVELGYPFWLKFPFPRRAGLRDRLAQRGIPRDNAFLFDMVYDWGFMLRALYVILRHGARNYLAEFPVYARVGLLARRLLGGSVLIAEHNVEYQRLRDQYPSMPERGYRLARSLELNFCNRSNAVVVVSEPDRRILARDGVDPRRLHLISHGVDLDSFDGAEPMDLRAEYGLPEGVPVLVYHGTYMYPPNLESMQVLADQVIPRLKEQGVAVKVLAVGAHPPKQSPHEDIVFTGSVESVAPYLKAADMAVVPLMQGGGTRMKLLDYFAAGIPVVSTAKGAEGLALQDGREILIRDDHADFAAAIAQLLRDESLASQLADNARRFVDRLDWRNIGLAYAELFRKGGR